MVRNILPFNFYYDGCQFTVIVYDEFLYFCFVLRCFLVSNYQFLTRYKISTFKGFKMVLLNITCILTTSIQCKHTRNQNGKLFFVESTFDLRKQ